MVEYCSCRGHEFSFSITDASQLHAALTPGHLTPKLPLVVSIGTCAYVCIITSQTHTHTHTHVQASTETATGDTGAERTCPYVLLLVCLGWENKQTA